MGTQELKINDLHNSLWSAVTWQEYALLLSFVVMLILSTTLWQAYKNDNKQKKN